MISRYSFSIFIIVSCLKISYDIHSDVIKQLTTTSTKHTQQQLDDEMILLSSLNTNNNNVRTSSDRSTKKVTTRKTKSTVVDADVTTTTTTTNTKTPMNSSSNDEIIISSSIQEETTKTSATTSTTTSSSTTRNNTNNTNPVNSSTTTHSNSTNNSSQYAYAYVVGGCNPESSNKYLGYFYNILVSAKILRDLGSTADVVVFIQLTHAYTKSDTLPIEHTIPFAQYNIRIHYIPKSPTESFYEIQLAKFNIVTLIQYKHVLFMDGDVMPLSNLDYLFHLSDIGILKESVILAGPYEPANGGFFMLSPKDGDYDTIQQIIRNREERTLQLGGYGFDEYRGWGQPIVQPDTWKSRKAEGNNWTFHAAFADQGLLYYWTKYWKQNVSILYGSGFVENWSSSSNHNNNTTTTTTTTRSGAAANVYMEKKMIEPFANYSKPIFFWQNACNKFLCDFFHYTGSEKPWLRKPPLSPPITYETRIERPSNLWWYTLMNLNTELQLNLDFNNWKTGERPSHGMFPTHNDILKRLQHKETKTES